MAHYLQKPKLILHLRYVSYGIEQSQNVILST